MVAPRGGGRVRHDRAGNRAAPREPRKSHAGARGTRCGEGRRRAPGDLRRHRRGRRACRRHRRAGQGRCGLAALDRSRGRGGGTRPGRQAQGERHRAFRPVLPRHEIYPPRSVRGRGGCRQGNTHEGHGKTRTERKLHHGTREEERSDSAERGSREHAARHRACRADGAAQGRRRCGDARTRTRARRAGHRGRGDEGRTRPRRSRQGRVRGRIPRHRGQGSRRGLDEGADLRGRACRLPREAARRNAPRHRLEARDEDGREAA